MNAFRTGSTVYGVPTENSDIDLVVLMEQADIDALGPFPIRFGKLNLIALDSPVEFAQWLLARKLCLEEAPVTRDRAVTIHKQCGISDCEERERSKTKADLIAEEVL